MDPILAQIQTLADNADEAGRLGILNALEQLHSTIESPVDTFMRLYNLPLQIATVRVGLDLGLFKILTENNAAALSVHEIAEKSGAATGLLERILRYLASVGMIGEAGPNQYTPSKRTYALADPAADAGICHMFDVCGPAIQAFPDFLAETNYREITQNNKTPFQKAFNTDLSAFQWLPQRPKLFDALQKVMTSLQSSDWIAGFDLLDNEARALPLYQPQPSEKPFFVDVGGGHGHQCIQLRNKYPNLHGRLVLQDLPEAVNHLEPIDGVKAMAQDFFQKQAVQGAKFYYLRRIFHDWPDTMSVKILRNLAVAMGPDSRILIDEIVLPDTNAHWQATLADTSMMILFAGKERTRRDWDALIEESGLRLARIHTYNKSLYNSIIVLELK